MGRGRRNSRSERDVNQQGQHRGVTGSLTDAHTRSVQFLERTIDILNKNLLIRVDKEIATNPQADNEKGQDNEASKIQIGTKEGNKLAGAIAESHKK